MRVALVLALALASACSAGRPGRWSRSRTARPLSPVLVGLQNPDELGHRLRTRVGERVKDVDRLRYTFRLLDSLGVAIDDALRSARNGAQFAEIATRRGAWNPGDRPALGDLILIEDPIGGQPDDIVAVVVDRLPRGTLEFLFLNRGVVRRGFVTPSQPSRQRDAEGRILNTFVRGGKRSDPAVTRYLSGELWKGAVAIDRLHGGGGHPSSP